MKNFRTYQLAVRFYQDCKRVRLPAHLQNQLMRASSSVALNLAEGRGRSTLPDQKRFFTIALGSIRECQCVVDLNEQSFAKETLTTLDQLAASCYRLIRTAR